jgi:hypothetical protein
MSKKTIVRGAKCVSAVAAGVLLTATVGSASAAPAPVAADVAEVMAPAPAAAVTTESVSWRETAATATTSVATRPSRAVVARRAQAAAYAKYTNFTLHSTSTMDMRGVERSLYRGKYYRAASETKRLCIVRRESEAHYDVVSASGSYFGAYQVSRELARGATWMMLKEHRVLMGDRAARVVLAKLRATPMNRWPRYWQDAAFHTVINWDHTLSGASHWAGGRWHC